MDAQGSNAGSGFARRFFLLLMRLMCPLLLCDAVLRLFVLKLCLGRMDGCDREEEKLWRSAEGRGSEQCIVMRRGVPE